MRADRLTITSDYVGRQKKKKVYANLTLFKHLNGFSIKPKNQEQVFVSMRAGEHIAEYLKNHKKLMNEREAERCFCLWGQEGCFSPQYPMRGTIYVTTLFSVRRMKRGNIRIKFYNQPPITVSDKDAHHIAMWIRNKNILRPFEYWEKVFARKTGEAL